MTNITFSFSAEVKNKLKASANVKATTQAVVQYTYNFMELSNRKAYNELTTLWCSPASVIEKNNFLKEAGVTVEVMAAIYNDLAANYALLHPNCWLNDDSHDFPESLISAVAGDRTILKKIKDTVGYAYAEGFDFGHLKSLLMAEKSNFQYGGLRKLGFTRKEAPLLLHVAKEIFDYIEENFTVHPAVEEKVSIGEATPESAVTAVEAVSEVTDDATSETTATAVEVEHQKFTAALLPEIFKRGLVEDYNRKNALEIQLHDHFGLVAFEYETNPRQFVSQHFDMWVKNSHLFEEFDRVLCRLRDKLTIIAELGIKLEDVVRDVQQDDSAA